MNFKGNNLVRKGYDSGFNAIELQDNLLSVYDAQRYGALSRQSDLFALRCDCDDNDSAFAEIVYSDLKIEIMLVKRRTKNAQWDNFLVTVL